LRPARVGVLAGPTSSRYAVDWTDQEAWSRPRRTTRTEPPAAHAEPPAEHAEHDAQTQRARCADPEAAWGHRRANRPGHKDEAFFGYYTQVVTIVNDEHGPEVPELVRRIHIAGCDVDPPGALVGVIERMAAAGITI